MTDFVFYVLPTAIGKARISIFEKRLIEVFKTHVVKTFDTSVSHVIVDDELSYEKVHKLLKLNSSNDMSKLKIIKSRWLSLCINEKKFLDSLEYEIEIPSMGRKESKCTELANETNFSCIENENTTIYSEEFENTSGVVAEQNKKGKWICMESSKSEIVNHNKHITDELEKLMKTYEQMNDRWRVLGYKKAIVALKNHPTCITSYEEAKNLRGIGEKLAEKICEIIESGKLRKVNELNGLETTVALNIFTKIWGAGPQTARLWVTQGFRTLEDLKEKATLSKHQQIGLKYYDDLCERMSRDEVRRIEETVKEAAASLRPGCDVLVCGSYRRGRDTCGDVDFLISHSDGRSHVGLFVELVGKLRSTGFLTDDLIVANSGEQQKYLGVCKLLGNESKHRRIDLIVVPYVEFFPALLYFTGSGHFNRSMRNLASKMGMSLNEHGLFKGVIRNKGVKIHPGVKLDTPTEKSIFEYLGVPYRPPEERDF